MVVDWKNWFESVWKGKIFKKWKETSLIMIIMILIVINSNNNNAKSNK